MFRRALVFVSCFALVTLASRVTAAEIPLAAYARVEVAPTKTSIYVGSVSMTLPAFTRANGAYETTYAAKVFPFFFSNENGRLSVEISDDALRKLAQGEVIEFKGRAVNDAGEERRVEGKAAPLGPGSGKLKVRVFVSKRIELIFNTTYRFPDVSAPAAADDR